jgi:STE24 endopeptidase
VHAEPTAFFTADEVDRASRYHRPLYRAILFRLALVLAVYGLFVGHGVTGLGWAGDAASSAAIVTLTAALVTLPLDYWRSYAREHRWQLSRQSLPSWCADRVKSTAISVVLVSAAWAGVIATTHAFPRWWPAVAAAAAALVVLVLTLLAPLLLEPLFNRFHPLADQHLVEELRELAEQAGVPIRNVLVADASRRTIKSNAYVSGLGPTRRVVVWDTLLQSTDERELKLIVAHELAHRRERHIVKGTALAMLAAVAAVLLLHLALATPQPADYPQAALLLTALQLIVLPFGAALSRRWERTADRYSLQLTRDREAYINTHLSLARSNLSDLNPPRLTYLAVFTHPTPPERLALAH